jgi:hypothetical protein
MQNNSRSNYSYLLGREQVLKKDRRIDRRYKYDSKFKVVTVNSQRLNLEVQGVDISISGIGFISNRGFRVNDMLEVIFNYKDFTIPVTVKVVHINLYDQGYFVGGQFIAMQNIYREVLKQLLF